MNSIYMPTAEGRVDNPFNRCNVMTRPQIPDEIVNEILKYVSPAEAYQFQTLTKSYMGVDALQHQSFLLSQKKELARAEILQYQRIFSPIGKAIPLTELVAKKVLSFDHIVSLDLSQERFKPDAQLKEILSVCPNLTHVRLEGCVEITNEGLELLAAGCPNLVSINLSDCGDQISYVGIQKLVELCPKLREINLAWCPKVADNSVIEISQRLPKLTVLNLNMCDITDEAINELANRCPNLTSINVDHCNKITSSAVERMKSNCPQLKVNRYLD